MLYNYKALYYPITPNIMTNYRAEEERRSKSAATRPSELYNDENMDLYLM